MKTPIRKKICLCCLLLSLTLWALVTGCSTLQVVYQNPVIDEIGPADPTVIYHDKIYYLYCTGDNWSYDVYRSTDLVHWTKGPKVFQPGKSDVWAPDVFYDAAGQKFYLYYSIQYTIGVAESDKPDSPFIDRGLIIQNAIDAHMYQDQDGSYYLYYKAVPGSRILVQKMASPLQKEGEPIELLDPTQPWEMNGVPVTEAPWILKHKETYYLLYSGSAANTLDYAIGYATSNSPTGPFVKHEGNPIIRRGRGVFGPGHGSVARDNRGNLWLVYHQQKDGSEMWNRFICIDRLWFDDRGVLHGQPTRGMKQPAPEFPGWFIW